MTCNIKITHPYRLRPKLFRSIYVYPCTQNRSTNSVNALCVSVHTNLIPQYQNSVLPQQNSSSRHSYLKESFRKILFTFHVYIHTISLPLSLSLSYVRVKVNTHHVPTQYQEILSAGPQWNVIVIVSPLHCTYPS